MGLSRAEHLRRITHRLEMLRGRYNPEPHKVAILKELVDHVKRAIAAFEVDEQRDYKDIREFVIELRASGVGPKKIAYQTGLHYNTVSKYLREYKQGRLPLGDAE